MTVLKPAPVSTRQFSFDNGTHNFSAEISSTNGLGRVYDDACDDGLTLVSSRTNREIVFVVKETHRDGEGDITHWTLVPNDRTHRRFTMTLWND